jgi:hypothetical protein
MQKDARKRIERKKVRGKNYLYHYFPAMAVKMENNGDGGEEGVND